MIEIKKDMDKVFFFCFKIIIDRENMTDAEIIRISIMRWCPLTSKLRHLLIAVIAIKRQILPFSETGLYS